MSSKFMQASAIWRAPAVFPNTNTERLFSGRDLLQLVVPLMLELSLTLLVGMIDSVMVAGAGEAAVSAISLVDTVMQLLIYLCAALGTGGAIVAGQYLGSGDRKLACAGARQLLLFAVLFSLAATAALLAGKALLLDYFFAQITPQVRSYADIYLTVTTFSVPAIAVYEAAAAIFRAAGNAKVTMYGALLMNAVNIAGNALFIYGLRMTTDGAALATVLARFAAAVLLLYLLTDERGLLFVSFRDKWHLQKDMLRKILSVGIPNAVENGMFQLGKILTLGMVAAFGTQAIAANAVTAHLSSIQVIPGLAISLAITTVVARCAGKQNYAQAKYYNRLLLFATYGALFLMGWGIYFALPLLLPLYNLSPQAAALAQQMLLIHTLGAVLIWPLAFDLPASMRAAGDVRFPMLVSVISMWALRIGAAWLLTTYTNTGASGVWLAMLGDWLLRAAVFAHRWHGGVWQSKRLI